jgi:hypothetical protein
MDKDDYFSNEYEQSKVAYENGPKEVRTGKGMPANKQFGNGNKMPQKEAKVKSDYPANPSMRHSEHR